MIASVIRFGRSWVTRFVDIQGVDRAMALAAQAFSALIPLLIVYSAVVSRGDGASFADRVVGRFELDGAAAASVRQAFTSSQTVEDSISLVGLMLLIVSALSFSRGVQRLYEHAYGLPTLGMRNTPWALAWLGLVALYSSLRALPAGLFDTGLAQAVVSIALAAAAWTATPYLLLGRRLSWRRLLPGAVLAALGMSALAASSVIWFPRTLASSADQFGVMGVAFALLSWLVAGGFVIVATATGGAVTSEALKGARITRRG
jgi:membrane protein